MKTLGVQTADFSVYYDLVQALRACGLSFVSLAPGDEVPFHVGVVLTTVDEASRVAHANVVPYTTPEETIETALRTLHGYDAFRKCVIGIDPGERPGIAVLADGRVMRLVHASSPETVRAALDNVLATLPAEEFVLRVGNGAPTYRDRILHTLDGLAARLELVDETRSTPANCHGNAERDTGAATNIALTPGVVLDLATIPPVEPTDGELRDIQRKSRMASQGLVTISRRLARHVALGRLTLDEAVDLHRQKA